MGTKITMSSYKKFLSLVLFTGLWGSIFSELSKAQPDSIFYAIGSDFTVCLEIICFIDLILKVIKALEEK